MKKDYIELMSRALTAYSDEHIRDYVDRVKTEGLSEHGFPRLIANLGVLITNGIRVDLLLLFVEMMDLCCDEIARGTKAANEFSVRELVCCLLTVEQAELVDREKTDAWRASLARVTPEDCYNQVIDDAKARNRNWILFGAVSEYLRQYAGLADNQAYIDLCVEQQMQFLDENGMYCDRKGSEVHQPMVYDMVSRGLFSVLFHFGYRGPHYEAVDAKLKKAALMMLEMQSVTGELPYGGRSNQFAHNEAWMATIFEYEANRYAKAGDMEMAKKFKTGAKLAIEAVRLWLDKEPIHHVKNRFPLDTNYGCEGYGYFDKYMITAASFLYTAYLICDDTIPAGEANTETCLGRTSHHFHKIYAKTKNYAVEFDTNPDPDYEMGGLGRVHRKGAPSAICLSLPCPVAAEAHYTVDREDAIAAALCLCRNVDGEWQAPIDTEYEIVSTRTEKGLAMIRMDCRMRNDTTSGVLVTADYIVDDAGVDIVLQSKKPYGFMIPAFCFDGETETKLTIKDRSVFVDYEGYRCRYLTNGTIVDTGKIACNRNGHYRVFVVTGEKSLRVHIDIEPV